ncbi:MAG: protein kinase [Labilithrix sp.]|nr:protein kinase [Labilithrix sp.]
MSGRLQPGYMFPGTVYRVVRHVATGGMGSLYEVEDTTVGRHYVLKTLHPELVERADLAIRMREEARALGKLQHPNIVQVITAGVTSDAQRMPFYVMERLVGHNLRAVLDVRKKEGGIGLGQALRIAIDVASALQHAHEKQLVHRDVKPENIFLHRGPKGTEIKLVDFGIVRMLNREATLTRGKFVGTMKYSSPEQITGLREIGPASDLYSLALVLYEMIRLRGPFDDAPDHLKIGFAHANETPSPLSLHVATTPPDVDALVNQALAKQPEARPPSCAAFAAALRVALERLEAAPRHGTDVELLSVQHPIDLKDDVTETSAGLPPTVPEGVVAPAPAPAPAVTQTDPAVSATLVAPPPTPPMGPPPLAAPGRMVTAVLGPPAPPPHAAVTPLQGAAMHPGALAPGGAAMHSGAPAPHGALAPGGAAMHPGAPPPHGALPLGAAASHGALPRGGAPPPGGAAMHPGAPAGARVVDRDAPTRVPPPSVEAPRAPSNDTVVDGPTTPLSPSVSAEPPPPKPQAFISTVHTRPRRDRASIVVVGIAAALALVMITGALLFVRRPWSGPHDAVTTEVPAK